MRLLIFHGEILLVTVLCAFAVGCSSSRTSASSPPSPAPAVSLSPSTLTFASQTTGTTSAAQQVTLSNAGTAALVLTTIAATGDFAETNTCGSSVAAGSSCTISVTFAPTATGARSGSLSVTDNASGSPHKTTLSGRGAAAQAAGCTETASKGFPSCMTVGSPTAIKASGSQAGLRAKLNSRAPRRYADGSLGNFQTAFAEQSAQLAALLNGTDPNPGQTLATLGQAVMVLWGYPYPLACFGPSIYYSNNPDSTPGNQGFPVTGSFPGGALGIWQPADSNGQACAPAQLNVELSHVSAYTQFGLALAAEAEQLAGSSFPANPGDSTDVSSAMQSLLQTAGVNATINQFTISYDGTSYTYTANFSVVVSSVTTTGSVLLTQTPGASQYAYSGLLSYKFDDGETNLPGEKAGTIYYQRNSQTSLDLRARLGLYATGSTPALDSNNELDPAGNWNGGMERFSASFDPTSPWLSGSYVQVDQPGKGNFSTVIFQTVINSDGTGASFFGNGDTIDHPDSNVIQFMDCDNFAPNLPSPLTLYAQYQPFQFDSNAGQYVPSSTLAAHIRYAPTLSCTWTDAQWNNGASGGFWYDRAEQYPVTTQGQQPATPNPIPQDVVADPNDSTYPLDLFGDGTSAVQTQINAAGFTMPALY